jgi:hypothetical protein
VKYPRFAPVAIAVALAFPLVGCTGASNVAGPASMLDSTPPPTPAGVHATYVPQTGLTTLAWDASAAPDLAHYDIFMASGDPAVDASYVKVATVSSGATQWTLPAGAVDQTYDVRVKAVDSSANASPFSGTVHTDVPSLETIVGGGAGGSTNPHTRRIPE